MEHVETAALCNIDRAADRVREYTTRQAANQETLNPPRIGDLILIRDHSKAGLTPHWESNVYRCAGYNRTRTQIYVEDKEGKKWAEAINHAKSYTLSPDFTETGNAGPSGLGGN